MDLFYSGDGVNQPTTVLAISEMMGFSFCISLFQVVSLDIFIEDNGSFCYQTIN